MGPSPSTERGPGSHRPSPPGSAPASTRLTHTWRCRRCPCRVARRAVERREVGVRARVVDVYAELAEVPWRSGFSAHHVLERYLTRALRRHERRVLALAMLGEVHGVLGLAVVTEDAPVPLEVARGATLLASSSRRANRYISMYWFGLAGVPVFAASIVSRILCVCRRRWASRPRR
jgi:hypothetical protein